MLTVGVCSDSSNSLQRLLFKFYRTIFLKLPVDSKTELMYFKQNRVISILNGNPLKLGDQLACLGSNISSTESDVNTCIGKA